MELAVSSGGAAGVTSTAKVPVTEGAGGMKGWVWGTAVAIAEWTDCTFSQSPHSEFRLSTLNTRG